ncbi:A/G-specific adenine glycosylase [Ethanoligenens harbinense]|uniref:Adenine DNA glycosylase n=1 Tax=Ethanoligenens harbinense (strain DSM 18485 / JCM 12961 / CGMCC 1.5033 / YUAN-3) TaxID=663278 RepID=E6U7G9_ETHHY|nr:A/G-specific adenine glycosylase [Ethanoligenens harbinense]ADU26992.1 A/G-specific adenine glycosylase [Ethanoligenens harbinense YUAN-3]
MNDRRKSLFVPEKIDALRPFSAPLLAWYGANARRLPWRVLPTPYRVWVSEIMLQQTRVEAVVPYYERFLAALPDLPALARAPEDRLLKLWEGLGYYSRVRNMQKAAQAVVLAGGTNLPGSYEALRALPGIGPYTAGAVASIAFGIPVPAVDGNVLRVLARLLACREDIALPQVKRAFEQAAAALLLRECPGDFNQAMMELGATVCLPNAAPRCADCPVRAFCAAARAGNAPDYPYKSPKKPRVVEERTVFVVVAEHTVLLRRRAGKGLLAGMWELPNLAGWLSAEETGAVLAGWGMPEAETRALGDGKHIFSHIEWRMKGLLALPHACPPVEDGVWANAADLAERYALPSAFRPYARLLLELLARDGM